MHVNEVPTLTDYEFVLYHPSLVHLSRWRLFHKAASPCIYHFLTNNFTAICFAPARFSGVQWCRRVLMSCSEWSPGNHRNRKSRNQNFLNYRITDTRIFESTSSTAQLVNFFSVASLLPLFQCLFLSPKIKSTNNTYEGVSYTHIWHMEGYIHGSVLQDWLRR